MRYHRRLLAFVAGLFAALALATPAAAEPTTPTTTPPAQLCEITVTVAAQWTNGYIVNIHVRNISDRPVTVDGTVRLQPPGVILQGWNATFTLSGSTMWIKPVNPVLPPGASITLGYVGSGPISLPTVYCH